jgi:hypothetical protein
MSCTYEVSRACPCEHINELLGTIPMWMSSVSERLFPISVNKGRSSQYVVLMQRNFHIADSRHDYISTLCVIRWHVGHMYKMCSMRERH